MNAVNNQKMKKSLLQYFFFVLIFSSCATNKLDFNKKEYRKSNTLVKYSGNENELQDGYLVLKENGYFKFYEKLWLIVTIKQGEYIGRYSQKDDTLYLNWSNKDTKQIKPYLSKKCIIDSTTKSLWFIDELDNKRLWGLHRLKEHLE
jgi:hypothetical protein